MSTNKTRNPGAATEAPRFTHRTVTGWISDFGSIPRRESWPSITLDERLMADLRHAFVRAQEAGYNEIILWGLLCGRSWSPYLPDTADAARRQRVHIVLDEARRCGLRVLMGLGLNSWGFDAIIAQHPMLDGGSLSAMCGSRPESQAWMERVIAWVMREYDPDGLSLQSADQGRCPCDQCQAWSALQYHARLNERTTAYVRSRWPDKLIQISTWGMDLSNPADLPTLQQMTVHSDVLNDYNNSSARHDPAYRRTLSAALPCAFGTEAGWWVDPPPFWERDRWFLPLALRNAPYYRALWEDGGRAIERMILPLENVGAEVGYLFDGLLLNDLSADPEAVLAQALEAALAPRSAAAREGLIGVWREVEAAYLEHARAGRSPQGIGLNQVHYAGVLPDAHAIARPEYLLRLEPEGLRAFHSALRTALDTVHALRPELGNAERAAALERSLGLALSDAERVRAWKA